MTPTSYNEGSRDTAPVYSEESGEEEISATITTNNIQWDDEREDDFGSHLGVFGKSSDLGGGVADSFANPYDMANKFEDTDRGLFGDFNSFRKTPVKEEDASDSTTGANHESVFASTQNNLDFGVTHAPQAAGGSYCFSPTGFMESPDLSSMKGPLDISPLLKAQKTDGRPLSPMAMGLTELPTTVTSYGLPEEPSTSLFPAVPTYPM